MKVEIVRKAVRYLELGWCQHSAARDDGNCPVDPNGPEARAWCLTAAIERARWHFPEILGDEFLDDLYIDLASHHPQHGPAVKSRWLLEKFNDAPETDRKRVIDFLTDWMERETCR